MHQVLSTVSGLELWQWRNEARQSALAADVPREELDWLLQDVAQLDSLSLRLESFKGRSLINLRFPLSVLSELWQRRLEERLPVQYLAGVAPWRNFALTVSPAVLIPRPETECLIDLAMAAVQNAPIPLDNGLWADLGTGSGAIALGLAEAFPTAIIHAVDYSASALEIAQLNADKLGFSSQQIQFHQGSWWQPLTAWQGQFSGMISNPPYIPTSWIPQLQPEVAQHEPKDALDGGSDGLDCIRQLVASSPNYLQPGGVWLIEMMAGQAEIVAELLQNQGSYGNIQVFSDLAGIERFALAYRI
jgi:release factor glutamine methyltransferase